MKYEMPYERFNAVGKENLTNRELIAIILRSGTKDEPVMDLAEKVLQVRDNPESRLGVLYDVTKEELMGIPGIGEVKAVRLLTVLELSRRLSQENTIRKKIRRNDAGLFVFDNPNTIADYYMESLRHEEQERVILLYLDTRLSLIRDETLTIGTINRSICSPRDVFRHALKAGAAAIIMLHNHPSGDPTPSPEDIDLTRRIARLGESLDIVLLDHLIIGDLKFTSMKKEGYFCCGSECEYPFGYPIENDEIPEYMGY